MGFTNYQSMTNCCNKIISVLYLVSPGAGGYFWRSQDGYFTQSSRFMPRRSSGFYNTKQENNNNNNNNKKNNNNNDNNDNNDNNNNNKHKQTNKQQTSKKKHFARIHVKSVMQFQENTKATHFLFLVHIRDIQ